ncbi:hypothetical protein [Streptomyces sp. NPDC018045]|uniref:hypothetical protein n=1 Tax=Streptomyces sp. NPDC018045 TaxID=3365037 RepID=UPI0037880295
MSGTDAPVHQIVFRWDADHAVGGAGVGPVAWSGNRTGLQPIYRKVASLLSVPGDGARESLARVELRGEPGHESSVLLIRRIPGQDRGGRPSTCSHALLGSASVLTPARCLGLHTWRWEGSGVNLREVEGRSLECVPPQALREATERAAPALTDRTEQFAGELTAVLAGRLREPRQRLSVLDHTGGDGPVPVLWAVWNLAGRALPGWSFATHDTRDGGPFRYVFVPRWPVSATQDQQLTRLDPARPDHDDPAEEAASRLVEHYLDIRYDPGALKETRRALAEQHVFGAERPDERVRLVYEALKWLSHAGGHRRARTDRVAEPREPLYDRAREERYESAGRDDRVYDNPGHDGRAYESTGHDGRTYDNPVFDNMRHDQEPPPRRAPEQQAGPPQRAGDLDRVSAPPVSRAVRAGTGLVRGVSAGELRQALHGNGAEDYLADSADSVLLEVLGSGLPAEQADRVARVLIARAPHRTAADALEVCGRVLRAQLFLDPYGGRRDDDPVTGPDGRERVRTAVRLYDGLVRPHSEQGSVPGLLRQILPDLWHGHHGQGREVLGHLLADGRPTGFGDQGWRALFEAVTRTAAASATMTAPPGHEEQPRGVRRFAGRAVGRGLRLPARRPRPGRPPDDAPDRTEATAGRIWVGALLMVIAVAVTLIAVIALAGS